MDLRVDVRGGGSGDKAFSLLLDSWISGPPARQRFLEPVRPLIEGRAPPLSDEQVAVAGGPAVTVLRAGMDGIEVTGSGAFTAGFARELAEAHPEWSRRTDPESIRREADLPMLRALRAILEDCGFLRVSGGRAYTAEPAVAMLDESRVALLMTLGCEIVWDHGFPTQAAELAAAAILTGTVLEPAAITNRVHPVLAEFCEGSGEPISIDSTLLAVSVWQDLAEAAGVMPDEYQPQLRSDGEVWPRPAGPVTRACLVAMLRYRVLRCTVLRN